jgi:hypothetical protein
MGKFHRFLHIYSSERSCIEFLWSSISNLYSVFLISFANLYKVLWSPIEVLWNYIEALCSPMNNVENFYENLYAFSIAFCKTPFEYNIEFCGYT